MNASTYIVTEIEDKRRVPAEELERLFKKYTRKKVYRAGSLKEALEKSGKRAGGRWRHLLSWLVVPCRNGKEVTGRRRLPCLILKKN